MEKYLLSTGKSTYREELYILDQFKIYLTIMPGDVPGASTYGFDFNLVNVMKADLKEELGRRVSNLVHLIQTKNGDNVKIDIESLEIVSEEEANLVVSVYAGGTVTDNINLKF